MRAVPYDPSRRALFQPEIGPTVFAPGAVVAPALFAAECARLAYKKFDRDAAARAEVAAALACTGYGDVAFFSVEGTDAYAATQASSGAVVVAFRGTEQDPRDLATDARFVKVAWPDGGMVHGGFATAVERYVNCCDFVCRVPPAAFGFVHPASPAYIDADGLVHADLATMDVRADRRRARGDHLRTFARDFATNLVIRDFADHSPINYVSPLLAATPAG